MARTPRCPECRGRSRELLGSEIGMTRRKCNDCGHSFYTEP